MPFECKFSTTKRALVCVAMLSSVVCSSVACSSVGSTTLAQSEPPLPLPTVTPTALPDAIVNPEALNVRSGPSTAYPSIGYVYVNDRLTVEGRNQECSWLQITAPTGEEGWVATPFLTLNLACESIPSVPIPDLPMQGRDHAEKQGSSDLAAGKVVELQKPRDPLLRGRQTFAWQPNFALEPGQIFELILWEPGQEYFGLRQTLDLEISIDLEDAIQFNERLGGGRDYFWSVRLIETASGLATAPLHDGHRFRLEHVLPESSDPNDNEIQWRDVGRLPPFPSPEPPR